MMYTQVAIAAAMSRQKRGVEMGAYDLASEERITKWHEYGGKGERRWNATKKKYDYRYHKSGAGSPASARTQRNRSGLGQAKVIPRGKLTRPKKSEPPTPSPQPETPKTPEKAPPPVSGKDTTGGQLEPVIEGRRVYVATPFGHPAVAKLKAMGAKWDPTSKRWWVGSAKVEQVRKVLGETSQARTENAKDVPADDARVYAKVTYKGRNYFVVAESHAQGRCKVATLNGPAFWVDMQDCELVKTYEPRQERGFRGRTGRTVHQTIGSIRSFVEGQKRAEARGEEACAACGKRGHLVHDMEDGLMKCRNCADMPAD